MMLKSSKSQAEAWQVTSRGVASHKQRRGKSQAEAWQVTSRGVASHKQRRGKSQAEVWQVTSRGVQLKKTISWSCTGATRVPRYGKQWREASCRRASHVTRARESDRVSCATTGEDREKAVMWSYIHLLHRHVKWTNQIAP